MEFVTRTATVSAHEPEWCYELEVWLTERDGQVELRAIRSAVLVHREDRSRCLAAYLRNCPSETIEQFKSEVLAQFRGEAHVIRQQIAHRALRGHLIFTDSIGGDAV